MLFGLPLILLMVVNSVVSASKCIYNDVTYQHMEAIPDICIDITCVNGQWETNEIYNRICGFCSLNDDPHIYTFDNFYYDWHGTCNYSISQLNFGYNEDYGIYGQFQQCGAASCVHHTTFTDNPNTVVEIDHNSLGNILINGNNHMVTSSIVGAPSPNQPVLFWQSKYKGCSMFLGSQGLLLKTCPNQIFVWAHPNLIDRVNGLCGHFNFDQLDDFTDRNGNKEPLIPNPVVFPESWLTADQSMYGCQRDVPQGVDPCPDEDLRTKMVAVCQELLGLVQWEDFKPSDELLQQAILNCASDLCNLEAHRSRMEEIEEWQEKMQTMLINSIIIEARTRKEERER